MKTFRVLVLLKGNPVYSADVKGKDKGRAVTNVLTNLYRGDMDSVKVYDLSELVEE